MNKKCHRTRSSFSVALSYKGSAYEQESVTEQEVLFLWHFLTEAVPMIENRQRKIIFLWHFLIEVVPMNKKCHRMSILFL